MKYLAFFKIEWTFIYRMSLFRALKAPPENCGSEHCVFLLLIILEVSSTNRQSRLTTMNMQICLCLLLGLLIAASAGNLRDGRSDTEPIGHNLVEEQQTAMASNRQLQIDSVCPIKNGAAVVFNVDTTITPGIFSKTCSDAALAALGRLLNTTLFVVGGGQMAGSIFVSSVCPKPVTIQKRRRLAITGYIWKSAGVSPNQAENSLYLRIHSFTIWHGFYYYYLLGLQTVQSGQRWWKKAGSSVRCRSTTLVWNFLWRARSSDECCNYGRAQVSDNCWLSLHGTPSNDYRES